jgi:tRNA(Ile)-lysidine synthase
MKYIVAVSGGVDSVVLLDKLVLSGEHELLVAHFDHGIRSDSAADARFVAGLAARYGLPFVSKKEALGATAGEALARKRRYTFLRKVASEHGAVIVTAHHADDMIETIAINITRGTGWRGVAVLGAKDIVRPLLGETKQAIYEYAVNRRLEWVEDSTNSSDRYLRNRLRLKIAQKLSDANKKSLLKLWKAQTVLKQEISTEVTRLLPPKSELSRYFFVMISEDAAALLLREVIYYLTGRTLLDDQLSRGVLAIKTAQPGTRTQLGEGTELSFTKKTFVALRGEKML